MNKKEMKQDIKKEQLEKIYDELPSANEILMSKLTQGEIMKVKKELLDNSSEQDVTKFMLKIKEFNKTIEKLVNEIKYWKKLYIKKAKLISCIKNHPEQQPINCCYQADSLELKSLRETLMVFREDYKQDKKISCPVCHSSIIS